MRRWILTVARSYEGGPALLLAGRAVQLVNGLLLSAILVHRFGLAVVGSFAIGLAAVNVVAIVCPLGLGNHLPRLRHGHGQLCFAGLTLQVAQLPLLVPLLWGYATLTAHDPAERAVVFTVALSGFFIGAHNMGLMMSILLRRYWVGLAAPLCETAGMAIGSVLAATPAQFALALLASRAASSALIWGGFPYRRLGFDRLREIGRASLHYVANDVLTVLPEHLGFPLLLSSVVSRAELGVFRLCQQLLMAADTPVWTFVQSRYPRMVHGDAAFHADLARQVDRLALLASGLCAAGSAVLALLVFRTPGLAPMMAVLSCCVLWRYRGYLYGQALRAAGRLSAVTALSSMRLVAALIGFWIAIHAFGLWGAIAALAVLSIASGSAYEWLYHRSPSLPALEPASSVD